MSETKSCVVCGDGLSPALAKQTDRCKECDKLSASVRKEMTARTRTTAFLGLIAGELSGIREALQRLAGGATKDEQGPKAKTDAKK